MRWYGVIDSVQEVTTFYSQDEVFVFIAHGRAILADNRILLLLKQLTSVLLFPDHVSDDLLVARFKNGKVLKYDLNGFGFGGGPFVYRGEIYWSRGRETGDSGPSLWRWDDSKLVPLSDREALVMGYDEIKDLDTMTRSEGWKQQRFQAGWDRPEVTMPLRSGYVRVYAEKQSLANGRNDRVRVMLAELGNSNSPEVLIDVAEGYQQISRVEYLKLKSQKSNSN